MLKLGAGAVKSLYVGERKVKQAYLGEKQVFTTKTSRLPAGYTEVEYVQIRDKAYFDTGVKPNSSTAIGSSVTVTMDVMPESVVSTGGAFFYSYYSSSSTSYYNMYMRYNGTNVTGSICTGANSTGAAAKTVKSGVALGTRMTVVGRFQRGGSATYLSVDDTKLSITSNLSYWMNSSMNNFYLFYRNSSSTSLNGRLYSCQIDWTGTLKRDYVPCINSSGVAGLYDLVEGAFLAPSGDGTVTAGPAV